MNKDKENQNVLNNLKTKKTQRKERIEQLEKETKLQEIERIERMRRLQKENIEKVKSNEHKIKLETEIEKNRDEVEVELEGKNIQLFEDEYMKSFTQKERKAYKITKSYLQTTFNIRKSNGFLNFIRQQHLIK